MQLSVDGFVAGPEGQLDWMTWNWDMQLMDFVRELTDSVDTILMGRKMSAGFIQHWEKAVNDPDDPSQPFAEIMVNTPKVIFSRTQSTIEGINAAITNEPITEVVNMLKDQPGKDMIVYGGAEFVSSSSTISSSMSYISLSILRRSARACVSSMAAYRLRSTIVSGLNVASSSTNIFRSNRLKYSSHYTTH